MRKFNRIFLTAIFACVGLFSIPDISFGADRDIVSVGYLHNFIQTNKNVTVPIDSGVSPTSAVSMKYLMKKIDQANLILNGFATTDYANTAAANRNIVSRLRGNTDAEELIQKAGFELTVTNINSFDFNISASGNFRVNWGDGNIQTITKTNTTDTTYSHNYAIVKTYTIQISGKATGYSSIALTPTISFNGSANKAKIASISGSMGRVFQTIGANNPRFRLTFNGCAGLTTIPAGLFSGISGAPVDYMFGGTFQQSGLTSIPAGLFSGISGAPAANMFYATFNFCNSLTGSIPVGLFSGISGAPADHMFSGTFRGCANLNGNIPAGLFGNIFGAPATYMFDATFSGCGGLNGIIPTGLFGTFSGDAVEAMFQETFMGCGGLTGISDGIWNLSGVTNINAIHKFYRTFFGCGGITSASPNIAPGSTVKLWQKFTMNDELLTFNGSTNMADFASIPAAWK